MDNNKKTLEFDIEKELELLNIELEENNKIFDQVKTHYDKMLNNKAGSSLKFISDQTSNVMNIRNNRITIIKEMINAKKLNAELTLKEMNLNKNTEGDEGSLKAISKTIYDMLKTENKAGSIQNIMLQNNLTKLATEENKETENVLSNMEQELEERMKEINNKKNNSTKENPLAAEYIFVCDIEGNIYALSTVDNKTILDPKECNIIIPEYEIEFVTDELTGEISAVNQYGDELFIIEF